MERFLKNVFSRSTCKQFFENDPVTCMTWIYDVMITSTSKAEISLKLSFFNLVIGSCRNSASFFVLLRIPSSTKQKNFFYFQLIYDAKSEIRSIEKPFLRLFTAIQAFKICQPATWPRKHHFASLAQKHFRRRWREKFDPKVTSTWCNDHLTALRRRNAKVCLPNGVLSGQLEGEKNPT